MTSEPAAGEAFTDVMLADDAWVAAEFDAIVAANFDPAIPSPPGRVPRWRGHADPWWRRGRFGARRTAVPVDRLRSAEPLVWPRGPPAD